EALLEGNARVEEAAPGPPAPHAETPAGRTPLRLMGGGFEHEPIPTPVRRGSGGSAPGQELTLFLDVETQKSADEVGGWQNGDDPRRRQVGRRASVSEVVEGREGRTHRTVLPEGRRGDPRRVSLRDQERLRPVPRPGRQAAPAAGRLEIGAGSLILAAGCGRK